VEPIYDVVHIDKLGHIMGRERLYINLNSDQRVSHTTRAAKSLKSCSTVISAPHTPRPPAQKDCKHKPALMSDVG